MKLRWQNSVTELCQRQAVDSWLAPLFEQVYSVSWATTQWKNSVIPWE